MLINDVTLVDHDDVVGCIVGNKNTGAIFSGSHDGTVKAWDLQTAKPTWTSDRLAEAITGVACVAQSDNVVVSIDRGRFIRSWDVRSSSSKEASCILLDSRPCSITSNENFILVGCSNGSVLEWTLNTQITQTVRRHAAAVYALAVCPETGRLLSGSDDGVVHGAGKIHGDNVRGVAWWESRPVSASWDGTVRMVDGFVVQE